MKRYSQILFVMWSMIGIMSSSYAAKSADALFQDAMMKETGERDPEAALPLYQLAIDRAGNDPKLVSKARLHMGLCLERIGKPKEAQKIYLEIIQDSAASLTEAVQAAQTNLDKLIAQEKKAAEEAARSRPRQMVLVHEFHDTRYSVMAGPAFIGSGSKTPVGIAMAVRYRITPDNRPLALYAQVGGLVPISGSEVDHQTKPFDASTTDSAMLKLKYQMHLGLVAELPHGVQKKWVPEVGIGAARTSSKIEYTSGASGSTTESEWGPRLSLDVRGYADRVVSFLIEGSYSANPYNKSISIASPAHNQTFGFPTSLWTIGAGVYVKIGWDKPVMRVKE